MDTQTLASVDLGSNSFHLLIVRELNGELSIVDKLRERVRLAAGLNAKKKLDEASMTRAKHTLELFGERIADIPSKNVRVVGTNTLRKATNRDDFLALAENALGHRVEVISGSEEARLIYVGVANDVQDDGAQRLVVDIGGGSTECIIGFGDQIVRSDSLYMGCVEYSKRFFREGLLTTQSLNEAITAARLELGEIHRDYKNLGWAHCYGSSGTINAVQAVLAANGRTDHCITAEDLRWLVGKMRKASEVAELRLEGLKSERAAVFPGGVCILHAFFKSLGIEKMQAANSALREGVIYDLLGRSAEDDIRDRTVRRMAKRYGADFAQAKRLERSVVLLSDAILPTWKMNREENRKVLRWACYLHEIGKAVSYSGYHRHGAYLIAHSDLVGFAREQQLLLAALVLGQRRKLVETRIRELVGRRWPETLRLIALLRLSSRLNRTRSPKPRPVTNITADGDAIHLRFPPGWLAERPLTLADLAEESTRLNQVGFQLTYE